MPAQAGIQSVCRFLGSRFRGSDVAAVFAALLLAGCSSGAVVTRGEGASLSAAQADSAMGGKYRVMVAAVIDKTDPVGDESLQRQVDAVNANRAPNESMSPVSVTHGVRDMLVTELSQPARTTLLVFKIQKP